MGVSDRKNLPQQEHEITAERYTAEEFIQVASGPSISPIFTTVKELICARVSYDEKQGLYRDRKETEKLSADELPSMLAGHEICIATKQGDPEIFVGYYLYKKLQENGPNGGKTSFVDVDMAVRLLLHDEYKREDKLLKDLLIEARESTEKTIRKNLQITLGPAAVIRDLALHVRQNTSFMCSIFFGKDKENELERIATTINACVEQPMSDQQARAYLLQIANVAMRTRGSPRYHEKSRKILPTASGIAFINAIYLDSGRFSFLKNYLNCHETKEEYNDTKDKENEATKPKDKAEKYYESLDIHHSEILEAAGLKITEVPRNFLCFSWNSKKIVPTEDAQPARLESSPPSQRKGFS